ncbi:MAG: hypothetical protein U5J83_04530 [Bryobacterales bacterium]|nr:hypothetical protein [Bryobacterales bacterium]
MKFTDLSLPLAALVFAAMISSCANPSASDRAAARQRADNSSELAVSQPVTNSYEIADSVVHAAAPAAAAPAAAQEGKGDAVKGKEVFDQCAICHNVDSDEEKMELAPKVSSRSRS